MSNPRSSTASLMNGPSSRATSTHPQSVDEVIADINSAIDKLSDKFNSASQEFFTRLDEISSRLDTLEQSIMASHIPVEDDDKKKENGNDNVTANPTRNSA
ncbi:hypothetical protein ABW19_dt0207007 [Dactylella cylindrospora]|nr:hypothetical protein ABW19_dt0207007 [Dactylella cylindrospora]